jgi:hypothetical protein
VTALNFAITAWQSWSAASTQQPDSSHIPPMLRRRLSPLGRAAFSVIEPLVQEHGAMPLVYVSRHGECSRTLSLLQDLARGELISPTAFGLSVHNAVAGLYSIHRGLTGSITALSAGCHNLLAGLLEALGIARATNSKVLCVFCDEPPPEIFHAHVDQPSSAFALALVISPGTGWCLEPGAQESPGETPVIALGDCLAAQQPELTLSSTGLPWRLSRTCP